MHEIRDKAIRKWHHGKLIVLWSWGGLLCAIALTDVKTAKLDQWTLFRLSELLVVLALLVTLSVITWIWLSGKEEPDHASEGRKADPESKPSDSNPPR